MTTDSQDYYDSILATRAGWVAGRTFLPVPQRLMGGLWECPRHGLETVTHIEKAGDELRWYSVFTSCSGWAARADGLGNKDLYRPVPVQVVQRVFAGFAEVDNV